MTTSYHQSSKKRFISTKRKHKIQKTYISLSRLSKVCFQTKLNLHQLGPHADLLYPRQNTINVCWIPAISSIPCQRVQHYLQIFIHFLHCYGQGFTTTRAILMFNSNVGRVSYGQSTCTLYCNGKCLKMNCLCDTLIEYGTFDVKAVGEIESSTHYVRSFCDMLILLEALLN